MRPEGQLGVARGFLQAMVAADVLGHQFKSDLEEFLVLFDPEQHGLDHIKRAKTEIDNPRSPAPQVARPLPHRLRVGRGLHQVRAGHVCGPWLRFGAGDLGGDR